ncbi:uncharacterized protein LOC111704199 [Eurytemora carolleeae]|uniref:uncharacterized protein LOC111704199 n=1 Tax=Eurytemora carolleeae TaxID=1294199 RepID=UPI000C774E72|nr:uncharacterized protein LOC111704199 [Eurytemora carolleeae]|eukprot:XP_023332120.1 uncharacterized protein LOC111704199 [Eurytemora affinis]
MQKLIIEIFKCIRRMNKMIFLQMILLFLIALVSSAIIQGDGKKQTVSERNNDVKPSETQYCTGQTTNLRLNQGQSLDLETPVGINGTFLSGCQDSWDVAIYKDSQELSQWRIKVEIIDMNLPCSSSGFRIMEDANRRQNVLYCNEKRTTDSQEIFFSHEHFIQLKFANENVCREADGCINLRFKFRIR